MSSIVWPQLWLDVEKSRVPMQWTRGFMHSAGTSASAQNFWWESRSSFVSSDLLVRS